jgi:valyl-tRNA synthetase
MNVPPSKKAKVCIATEYVDTFTRGIVFMQRLASASSIKVGANFDIPGAVTVITDDAKIYIPMNELVDFAAERERLNKQLDAANGDLAFIQGKLNNPGFVSKAPASVVEAQREQESKILDKIAMLKESIATLA